MERQERNRLLERLRRDARLIAMQFDLQYQDITAEHPRVKSRYGVCYADGLIKIRLNHVRTGKPLKYSSLIDTLCHELAHLRHFDHGPQFKAFFLRLLSWARRQRIYQPGPVRGHDRHRREQDISPADLPLYPALTRRNGVLVFSPGGNRASEGEQTRPPPWERAGEASTPPSRPVRPRASDPGEGPAPGRTGAGPAPGQEGEIPERRSPPPRPVQLSLF